MDTGNYRKVSNNENLSLDIVGHVPNVAYKYVLIENIWPVTSAYIIE